jgi:hypothetical protein
VEDYAREHEEASRNIQQYLSNPINAYLLVKRLTTDWRRVEELITEDVGKAFVANITNSRSDLKFPTEEDLNGAAVALMRLQDTYKLETAQVARGVLNGVQYSTGLSGEYADFACVHMVPKSSPKVQSQSPVPGTRPNPNDCLSLFIFFSLRFCSFP